MKKIFLSTLAVLTVTVTFVACKKDDKKTTTTPQPTFYLKGKINDTAFSAITMSAQMANGFSPQLVIVGFAGASTDSKAIALMANEYNGTTGTFIIDSTSESSGATCGTANYDEEATSGEIKITGVTSSVTGTFHFSTPSYNVTEGTFNVQLQ